MARRIIPAIERFMAKVEPEPNSGCWLWTGATVYGYGTLLVSRNRNSRAHRIAWEIFRGPIPGGVFVCHRCDVRACVNPDHLFLGTNMENCHDMARKGRGTKSPSGLPYGVRRHRSKFQAIIGHRRRDIYGGTYFTIEEAAQRALQMKSALLSVAAEPQNNKEKDDPSTD
jgi:hypothetical protein